MRKVVGGDVNHFPPLDRHHLVGLGLCLSIVSWNASVSLADSSGCNNQTLKGKAGTFTTFDPPGSADTFPLGINPAGAITGWYIDASGYHSFLRARDGTLTTIDVPGAAGTQALAINPAGAIVGGYSDGGFLRAPDGTFTTFEGTPTSINPAGTMTGFYTDASSTVHGVLRIPCKPNGR